MSQAGYLLIADISGYTDFIKLHNNYCESQGTPNIHMCTIKDFFTFSKTMNFKIFKSLALMNKNVSTINSSNLSFKNLFCELGIFLIEK